MDVNNSKNDPQASGSFRSPVEALCHWAKKTPDRIFLSQPVEGGRREYSFAECEDVCRRMASALLEIGLGPGDRVAILAKNCAEWFLADWAIQIAGMVPVPIYPTAGPGTISYVIEHSESRAVFVGPLDGWEKQEPGLDPDITRIAMPYPTMSCQHQWQDLVAAHAPVARLHTPDDQGLLSILYTSGSTGKPKGVMLSSAAYRYACQTTVDTLEMGAGDRLLSYLPLAHITERAVVEGPAVYAGAKVSFVESLQTFPRDLKAADPTLFISVPRLWVKFQSGVHAKLPPRKLNFLLSLPVIGKRVAQKIRSQLGFGNCRMWGSGTAPISAETLHWYSRLGIDISEAWGMTEVTGIGCMNSPFRESCLGTIGLPFPGSEIKISEVGELLFRGPGLFSGYYKQPDLTREVFTEDGFFRTGDKAEWDESVGAFRITGRVKDLFKSAKGKYVTPVPIESHLAANPLVEQVCVMGSGLPQPVAVVVLSEAAAAMTKADIEAHLETSLNTINGLLESHERMAALVVARDEWSIENEMLTPTMKIKRDVLEQKYGNLIAETRLNRVNWE